MSIASFDHVAIPTDRPEELIAFYGALGFAVPSVIAWRESGVPFYSIQFGNNKINIHCPAMWQNPDFDLKGPTAAPGCGDFCFVWEGDAETLHSTLERAGAEIVACGHLLRAPPAPACLTTFHVHINGRALGWRRDKGWG